MDKGFIGRNIQNNSRNRASNCFEESCCGVDCLLKE